MVDGTLSVEATERDNEVTTVDGTKKERWAYRTLRLVTGGAVVEIEIDAGDWSTMLADQRRGVPARVTQRQPTARGAA